MSDCFIAILAGAIQGVSEFLPISSSGHLVLFHEVFNFNLPDNLLFDVVLHCGTLVSLLIFFRRDVEKIIRGFFSSLANWNLKNNFNQRLAWLVILGTLPAAFLGYFFEDLFENFFRSGLWVAIMMIIVGCFFWLAEKIAQQQKNIQRLTWRDSFLVGLSQAVALVPGVSRSGITIITGLTRGLKREDAARFSFFLSMPIIFGAGLAKILTIDSWTASVWLLVWGFVSSTFFGYVSVKYLLRYLKNHSLNIFAWYRLMIGCLILIWWWWGGR